MPLFAVSLLSECHVSGVPEALRGLAIHVVTACDRDQAYVRGAELGIGRQHAYRNADGDEVSWEFRGVVECQELFDGDLVDGVEVSSWLFRGKRLCLNEQWSPPPGE